MIKNCKHCILGLAIIFAGSLSPMFTQAAQNVGIASAVLPQAKGAWPNQTAKVLQIGVDIVANERVVTDAEGKLQLLFLDGSALTVGPNSDVVVDRFVYDAEAKSGTLAFSATKGVFRLVGGKISKKTPVILRTPNAVIGIRGGIATARTDGNSVTATFLFGKNMSVESGGATVSVTRPGFQINANGGQPPGAPQQASAQQLSSELNALESDDDQGGDTGVDVNNEDVANSQLSALGSDAPPNSLAGGGGIRPGDAAGSREIAVPVNDILAEASQDTATEDASGGSSGSSSDDGLTLTDFSGRGKRGTSTLLGTSDADTTQNVALSSVSISNSLFTASSSQGSYSLTGPSVTGEFSVTGSTPYGDVTGTGFLSSDSEFLLYELSGSKQLIFAGVTTALADFPTSGVTSYEARDDFTLGGSNIPLIPSDHGGDLTPLNTAKAIIYWGTSGAGADPAFLSVTLALSGSGSSQQQAFSLLVGSIDDDDQIPPFMAGDSIGSSMTSATGDYYFYDGNIATQDSSDGGDFFGIGPDQAVLGAEQVDSTDTVLSRGIKESLRGSNTTIYPNVPLIATSSSSSLGATRSTRVMAAYVGGVARDFDSGGTFLGVHKFYSENTTSTTTVDGVTVPVNRIQTSAAYNNVEGAFNITSPLSDGIQHVTLDFGGLGTSLNENSAFIDDGHFGAIGFESGADSNPDIGVFRNTDISLSSITPSGVTMCTCSYVTWGFWGAGSPTDHTHEVALAAWVAGERVANSNLNNGATGSYSGTLIGSIANGDHSTNGTVATYTAVGSYSFDLSIGSADITVTNGTMSIDGASLPFSGPPTSTGSSVAEFVETISGSRSGVSLSGTIRGAFFGTPANTSSVPRNAAGFFAANDSDLIYQVSGIHMSEN